MPGVGVSMDESREIARNAMSEARDYLAAARKAAKTERGVLQSVAARLVGNDLMLAKINQKRRHDLEDKVAALEAKIAKLETEPRLKFMGVHEPGRVYDPGMMVVRAGGLWHCNTVTTKTPGTCGDWQLATKSGSLQGHEK